MPRYSIVIPAYNEAKRLGATLDRVLKYVAGQQWDAEVIVVNDGSRDESDGAPAPFSFGAAWGPTSG